MDAPEQSLVTPRAAARRVRERVAANVAARIDDAAANDPGIAAIHAAKNKECSVSEELFAHQYILLRNSTRAYEKVYDISQMKQQSIWQHASSTRNLPHVARRISELMRASAAATVIDVSQMLMDDFEIVQASREGSAELSAFIWQNCRHCNGKNHKYQWLDESEYGTVVAKLIDENETRRNKRQQLLPVPDCEGGFGFDQQQGPHTECPSCGGLGIQRAVFADTRRLSGAAATLFKGIKQTSTGIEVITHDVDKAKDRLFRAFGMYGDDAASVARAAAAGGAAGAAAGKAAQRIMEASSPEDAARAYLEASQ